MTIRENRATAYSLLASSISLVLAIGIPLVISRLATAMPSADTGSVEAAGILAELATIFVGVVGLCVAAGMAIAAVWQREHMWMFAVAGVVLWIVVCGAFALWYTGFLHTWEVVTPREIPVEMYNS